MAVSWLAVDCWWVEGGVDVPFFESTTLVGSGLVCSAMVNVGEWSRREVKGDASNRQMSW